MAKSKKAIPLPPARPVQQAGKPQHLHSIGILMLIFYGIFGLIGSVASLILSFVYKSLMHPYNYSPVYYGTTYGYLISIISVIISVLWIIFSYGVMTEKPASRRPIVFLAIVSIISGILNAAYSFLRGNFSNIPQPIGDFVIGIVVFSIGFGLILQSLVVWYFTRADVKAYYKHLGDSPGRE